jgi:hypothetical protein
MVFKNHFLFLQGMQIIESPKLAHGACRLIYCKINPYI